MNRVFALALLLAALSVACATPVARRSYQRDDLGTLPIQRLDLVVVASSPEAAGDELDVSPFRSLVTTSKLLEKSPDPKETALLAAQVRAYVEARAFRVERTFTPGHGLDLDTVLSDLVRTSTADAVLVVRAVPIDHFSMVQEGTELNAVNLGLGIVRTDTAREHHGRLYLGQSFLFSAVSGLRLASRQAPDYPDGGRLTYGHPFLENGIVLKEDVKELSPELAELAAERFTAQILSKLPTAKSSAPGALQALTAADDDDGQLQVFLDEVHIGLELSVQHRIESLEVPLNVGAREVAALEFGDFAPSGIFQLHPRATFWSPSGFVFGVGLPVGFATQDLRRTLLVDDPLGGDATIQRLEVDGLQLVGLVLDGGVLVPLTTLRPTLFLLPRGFFATEIWFLDGSGSATRTRATLGLGTDLVYRPGDGPVFVRLGLEGRLGLDFSAGGLLLGFASTLGAGWLF